MSEVWNYNLEQAPKSTIETKKVKHKKELVDREYIKVRYVWSFSQCGKVIKTMWLPKEKRWEFYTKDQPPICWQPYYIPEPPKEN